MELDIEKLERKMPDLPENFFAQMQQNVLQNTVYKKPETKTFQIGYPWAAAAALAIIAGLGFFITSGNGGTTEPLVVKTEIKDQTAEEPVAIVNTEPVTKTAERIAYENFKEDLAVTETKTQARAAVAPQQTVEKTARPAEVTPEENIDMLLSSFTSEELEELSDVYEQDIYLDLYN